MTLRSIFLVLLLAFSTALSSRDPLLLNLRQEQCGSDRVRSGNLLIAEFREPADWTWIVACDESAWQRIELMSNFQKAVTGSIMGLTDLDWHITYIRGNIILHPIDQSANAQPRHVIAHILAKTHKEDKAEAKAQDLLREAQTASLAVSH